MMERVRGGVLRPSSSGPYQGNLRFSSGGQSPSRTNHAKNRGGNQRNHTLLGALFVFLIVYINGTLLYLVISTGDVPTKDSFVMEKDQTPIIQALMMECSFITSWQNCTKEDFENQGINITSPKGFVTIAIEVNDPTASVLHTTLSSIMESSTPEERNDVSFIIFLTQRVAPLARYALIQMLQEKFSEHLGNGSIQVVWSPMAEVEGYIIEHILKSTSGFFSDSHSSLSLKSQPVRNATVDYKLSLQSQNGGGSQASAIYLEATSMESQGQHVRLLDLTFLFKFYQLIHRTDYFMLISGDVTLEKGFITSIENFVRHHTKKFWITLDFATVGFIGKLYRRETLKGFAEFCLFFSRNDQPIELLYQYYNDIRLQRHTFLREPSIFRRISNRSLILERVDPHPGHQRPPDNPPGTIFSTMEFASGNHRPQEAYSPGDKKYFYGKFPKRGDEIVLVFGNAIKVQRIKVKTGLRNFPKRAEGATRDLILDGKLELSHKVVNKNAPIPVCADYETVGYSILGSFMVNDVDKMYVGNVACVRISLSHTQVQWLAVPEISIWVV